MIGISVGTDRSAHPSAPARIIAARNPSMVAESELLHIRPKRFTIDRALYSRTWSRGYLCSRVTKHATHMFKMSAWASQTRRLVHERHFSQFVGCHKCRKGPGLYRRDHHVRASLHETFLQASPYVMVKKNDTRQIWKIMAGPWRQAPSSSCTRRLSRSCCPAKCSHLYRHPKLPCYTGHSCSWNLKWSYHCIVKRAR